MPVAIFEAIKVRWASEICYVQIYRPENNNAIDDQLINELHQILDECEASAKIVVLSGMPEVFCFGADFKAQQTSFSEEETVEKNANALYNLWLKLATGAFISIAQVSGKTNAGGVGFVAACDLVLCQENATFSLSELLFGLMPACVMPFLIRKIGLSKSNYLTLMTQPINAKQAFEWGLVDALDSNVDDLLRKHLLRLRLLPKNGIARYKSYLHELDDVLYQSKAKAIAGNVAVFSDQENQSKIERYINTGLFPWQND
ncbi:enoyl-CoA hydratase/isomerase [Aliikangiella sp. IMCC44359]|uniref:enoyl-CoA hydratase/isomerase n=1 Tax=Aliikangiella sp. IMCC44359 TaxID=3459125 RepID=UPI00403B3824